MRTVVAILAIVVTLLIALSCTTATELQPPVFYPPAGEYTYTKLFVVLDAEIGAEIWYGIDTATAGYGYSDPLEINLSSTTPVLTSPRFSNRVRSVVDFPAKLR